MNRTKVVSALIRAVGYDPEQSTLEIEFGSGAVFQYLDVPEHIHAGLLAAASKGVYFSAHIKGRYWSRQTQ